VSIPSLVLSSHEWTALYRREDGEQQPISPVEREFGAETQGKRHGLEIIRSLVDALGNPHLKYPTIHVGGSKGKGSTVAILSSILRAAGYRVGTYTSPSLTHFGERIQVNGRPITDDEAESYIARMQPIVRALRNHPRFFEAATAIAFEHFARQEVDVAVIEVGLGGRLDATNVVLPELSVITSIELEHTQILGDTLVDIAVQKSGIIKQGVPTITAIRDSEPLEIIEQVCLERDSTLMRLGEDFGAEKIHGDLCHQQIDFWSSDASVSARLKNLQLGLPGEAQSENAATAIMAAKLLTRRFKRISESAIRQGLQQVRWPGRLELIDARPRVLLDVAHTPASARQLRKHLDQFFESTPKTLVIGMLRDKRAAEVAAELADAFDKTIVAPVKWFRSMELDLLQAAFLTHRGLVETAPSICLGIEQAMLTTPPDGLVVVAGSLFAVGEAKRRFDWGVGSWFRVQGSGSKSPNSDL